MPCDVLAVSCAIVADLVYMLLICFELQTTVGSQCTSVSTEPMLHLVCFNKDEEEECAYC